MIFFSLTTIVVILKLSQLLLGQTGEYLDNANSALIEAMKKEGIDVSWFLEQHDITMERDIYYMILF